MALESIICCHCLKATPGGDGAGCGTLRHLYGGKEGAQLQGLRQKEGCGNLDNINGGWREEEEEEDEEQMGQWIHREQAGIARPQ